MKLKDFLLSQNINFAQVIDLAGKTLGKLNFTADNPKLAKVPLDDTRELARVIREELKAQGADFGYGGYNENRVVYQRSEHFGRAQQARTIHLGTDIWCPAGTPVHAPLDAAVHSFKINDNFGDYGPTIILEHRLKGRKFYTLYGHLSKNSLNNKQTGQSIKKGQKFAETGVETENGQWPPHLHFQIVNAMKNYWGDYPGVCKKNEKNYFLEQCPDPKIILTI